MTGGGNGCITVLGMHRSGTSCLAGILERAGVCFGKVSTANVSNPNGNREYRKILNLHDELLRRNEGRWDDPPGKVVWSAALVKDLEEIVGELCHHDPCGFKDPRTLFTLEKWLEKMPGMTMVGTFRHPAAVAESLGARNGFAADKSLALWEAYNEKLLDWRKNFDIPLLCFDKEADEYRQSAMMLLEMLGLPGRGEAVAFFEPRHRHHDGSRSPVSVPPAALEKYRALAEAAL